MGVAREDRGTAMLATAAGPETEIFTLKETTIDFRLNKITLLLFYWIILDKILLAFRPKHGQLKTGLNWNNLHTHFSPSEPSSQDPATRRLYRLNCEYPVPLFISFYLFLIITNETLVTISSGNSRPCLAHNSRQPVCSGCALPCQPYKSLFSYTI